MKFKCLFGVGLLLVSGLVSANSVELHIREQAERVVKSYKEMRKLCSGAEGGARVICFNQLHKQTSDYKEAKKLLVDGTLADDSNLHVVTNAY